MSARGPVAGEIGRMIATMEDTEDISFEHEPVLVPREQLLNDLHTRGFNVTEWQLRSWATYGVLPHPIRRAPSGAPDGKARAMYPPWMAGVIEGMLIEKAKGRSRDELRDIVRSRMKTHQLLAQGVRDDEAERQRRPPHPRIPRALQRAVWDYVDRIAAQTGKPIHDVKLHVKLDFMDEEGYVDWIDIERPKHR